MATYYVRSSGGNDANDGLSFANAFATIIKAESVAAAGDVVGICADGTHLPAASIQFVTASGTATNWITYKGMSATGEDDGTVATISGANLGAAAILMQSPATGGKSYIALEGLRLTASKGVGFYGRTSTAGWRMSRVRIDNSASHGIHAFQIPVLDECEIDHNGGEGIRGVTAVPVAVRICGCKIHHNAGAGVNAGEYTNITRSQIYRNTGRGILFATVSAVPSVGGPPPTVESCTIFANGASGIEAPSTWYNIALANNIIRLNTGYGVKLNGGTAGAIWQCRNNCVHGNTTDAADFGATLPGHGNIYADPKFTTETDGSEDLNLQAASPCRATGLPTYTDMGALQHQETASGHRLGF